MLLKTCSDISTNKCYGKEINSAFASYHRDDVFKLDGFVTNAFFANIKKISSKLINSSNKEAFYKDYYGEIIFNCQSYFPSLDFTHGSLLTTELCEKIVNEVQFLTSPEMVVQQPTVSLTERDINCIEYIGGYVLRKVFYSLKMKQTASDTMLSILSCFKSDESDKESLVSVLNRGGLWTINESAKNLFILAEKKFRAETKNETRLQKIYIDPMASARTKDMNACSFLNDILDDCPAYDVAEHSEEVANILEKLFTMYFRVRCFSLTKDLIVKLRNKNKADLEKKKALRKELKRGIAIEKE